MRESPLGDAWRVKYWTRSEFSGDVLKFGDEILEKFGGEVLKFGDEILEKFGGEV